jgi:hypothetical protein
MFFLVVMQVSFLPGCGLLIPMPTNQASTRSATFDVIKIPDDKAKCSCLADGATRYAIKNTDKVIGSYTIRKIEQPIHQPKNSKPSLEASGQLSPGKEVKFKECSIEDSNEVRCDKAVTYIFNGMNYPDTPELSEDILIGRVDAFDGAFKPDMSPPHSCLSDCIKGKGCFYKDVHSQIDAPKGEKIAKLISAVGKHGSVSIKEIMSLTSNDKDPNNKNPFSRSEFLFKSGTAYNYGNEGIIQGSYGKGKANISIPHALKLSYKVKSSEQFSLSFKKSKTAPTIQFINNDMKDLSGAVKQVDYFDGLYAFEINSGVHSHTCFAIRVRKQ